MDTLSQKYFQETIQLQHHVKSFVSPTKKNCIKCNFGKICVKNYNDQDLKSAADRQTTLGSLQ